MKSYGNAVPHRLLSLGLIWMALSVPGGAGAQAGERVETPLTTCTAATSPAADALAAQAAAQRAAQGALSAAAAAYRSTYGNASYDITLGTATVQGDSARVPGSLTLRATQRSDNKVVSGTYRGVVLLTRSGCTWEATGYEQEKK